METSRLAILSLVVISGALLEERMSRDDVRFLLNALPIPNISRNAIPNTTSNKCLFYKFCTTHQHKIMIRVRVRVTCSSNFSSPLPVSSTRAKSKL